MKVINCSLVFLAVLLAAKTAAEPLSPSPLAEAIETQSYNCGRNLAALVGGESQPGPLFTDGHLIFTSLEAQDMSKMLIVNGGTGNFVLRLEGNGLNRIRFILPGPTGEPPRTFFLSYVHGGAVQSRYFEYAEGRAPIGRDQADYALMVAKRAENLDAHVIYAIQKTAQATVNALGDGRLTRQAITPQSLDPCKAMSRQVTNLRHDLDSLELMALGAKPVRAAGDTGRLPSSVAAARANVRQRALLRPNTTSSFDLRASSEWRQRVQNKNSK